MAVLMRLWAREWPIDAAGAGCRRGGGWVGQWAWGEGSEDRVFAGEGGAGRRGGGVRGGGGGDGDRGVGGRTRARPNDDK